MLPVPKKPNVEDAHSFHHAVLHERVIEGNGLLIPGAGIRISINDKGQYVVESTGGGTGGGATAWDITMEWDPNRTYNFSEVAIISLGDNAGTYVYINESPSAGHAPYAGGGWWAQLPGGTLGQWQ